MSPRVLTTEGSVVTTHWWQKKQSSFWLGSAVSGPFASCILERWPIFIFCRHHHHKLSTCLKCLLSLIQLPSQLTGQGSVYPWSSVSTNWRSFSLKFQQRKSPAWISIVMTAKSPTDGRHPEDSMIRVMISLGQAFLSTFLSGNLLHPPLSFLVEKCRPATHYFFFGSPTFSPLLLWVGSPTFSPLLFWRFQKKEAKNSAKNSLKVAPKVALKRARALSKPPKKRYRLLTH